MCGRYRVSKKKQLLEEYFDSPADFEEDWAPHYNIAPTQLVPSIRQDPKSPARKLSLMRWGLIPSWSKDASGGAKLINARAETISTTPAFANSFKLRRCLIPADGFYEWRRMGKIKQPYCFEVNNGELFGFAGIWDRWKDPAGAWIKSCSILTTTANTLTGAIHDRMPVILEPGDYDLWLDPQMQNIEELTELLKPLNAQVMRSYPVSTKINNVTNDDESCSLPIELDQTQTALFS
jgi:putative SOS response-associated peptidase YedK